MEEPPPPPPPPLNIARLSKDLGYVILLLIVACVASPTSTHPRCWSLIRLRNVRRLNADWAREANGRAFRRRHGYGGCDQSSKGENSDRLKNKYTPLVLFALTWFVLDGSECVWKKVRGVPPWGWPERTNDNADICLIIVEHKDLLSFFPELWRLAVCCLDPVGDLCLHRPNGIPYRNYSHDWEAEEEASKHHPLKSNFISGVVLHRYNARSTHIPFYS